jgi:hypothetical protein
MRVRSLALVGLAALSLWSLVFLVACDTGDELGEPAIEVQEGSLRRSWPRRFQRVQPPAPTPEATPAPTATPAPAPAPAGASAPAEAPPPAPAADCSICTKANACCQVVSGGPLCTFSAATCEAEPPDARGAYVRSCLTLLDTVEHAWKTLPAPCR